MNELVTVLIPTSPIPRHPNTDLIEECLKSIRGYFETARIIIMADGVRKQVESRREQYEEYRRRMSEKVSRFEYGRCEMAYSLEPEQQSGVLLHVLPFVTTPYVLFVEHDAILRHDPQIRWWSIFKALEDQTLNMVRFYNWDHVPWKDHEYLMRGDIEVEGTRFVKTVQFSGWPFVARTDYLRQLMKEHCNVRSFMIETALYGPVLREPWEKNKIAIYAADEQSRMFTHRDGRTDETTGVRDPGEW